MNQIDAWKKLLLLFISTPQDGMVGPNIKRWPESVGGDGSDFSFLLMCLTGGVTAGPGRRSGAKQTLATGHGLELVSGLIHNVLLSTVRSEVKKRAGDCCAYE